MFLHTLLVAILDDLHVTRLNDSIEVDLGMSPPKVTATPNLRRINGTRDSVEYSRQSATCELVFWVSRNHGVNIGDQLLVADAIGLWAGRKRGVMFLKVMFFCCNSTYINIMNCLDFLDFLRLEVLTNHQLKFGWPLCCHFWIFNRFAIEVCGHRV